MKKIMDLTFAYFMLMSLIGVPVAHLALDSRAVFLYGGCSFAVFGFAFLIAQFSNGFYAQNTARFASMGLMAHGAESLFSTAPIWAFGIPAVIIGALGMAWTWARHNNTHSRDLQSSQQVDRNPGMQMANQPAAAREEEKESHTIVHVARVPKSSFSTLAGMADTKERLLRAGKSILKGEPRNGILLHGEPGNGKTVFADALAGELGIKIVSVSFGDVNSKWVGQTTEQVRQVFADARAQAPCVLFVDEIDSLISDRGSVVNADSETAKTTNVLLTELVDLRGKGVVIIAATNYYEKLDGAGVREGRFDFKVEIPCPDYEAREAILLQAISKYSRQYLKVQPVVKSEGVQRAATRWNGFSCARLDAIAHEAIDQLSQNKGRTVSFECLKTALRTIQGRSGNLPKDTPTLDKLMFSETLRMQLDELALRMGRIEEIEKMGGNMPGGLLFFGPAGTGKTLTARSLAKTSGWAFLSTSGNDLLREPGNIDKLLKTAADLRPCIVFIDEADDILANRMSSPYSASITNKLLTAMDGATGKVPDVLFIAATNHPDNLDPATMRGGRFTEKVEFTLPDRATIATMVSKWKSGLKVEVDHSLSNEMFVDALHGLAPANINAVLQAAVNKAVTRGLRAGESVITHTDLEEGYYSVING